MNTNPAFETVVAHFGGIKNLAQKLGLTRHAIYMWRGRIPRSRAYEIQALTKGKIKAEDILKSDAA